MPPSVAENVAPSLEVKTARIVESTIQAAGRMATLPAVAMRFIHLCENPDTAIDTLSQAIDPVLGAKILRLVNSAYYGVSRQVNSIKHAIMILGINAVKNIAIATSLVKLVRGGKASSDFNAGELWTHSIAVAACARLLAQKSNLVSPDEAFLAGMIHDIGIILEMQVCGPKFTELIKQLAQEKDLAFSAAEQNVLGATHEAIGAALCDAWRFPESLKLSTGFHHRPWEVAEDDRQLPAFVHIADVLVARRGLGYARTVETDAIDPELREFVQLSDDDLGAVERELPELMQESKRLLSDDK